MIDDTSYYQCCICGQLYRKSYKGIDYKPDQYCINGRGKNKSVVVFHWECYYEQTIGAQNAKK